MKTDEFHQVLNNRINLIQRTLARKASEYVENEDRLGNFKDAARSRRTIPEDALMGMRAKHETALEDYIQKLKRGEFVPLDWWLEKIGDSINYLILLEALILERYANMTETEDDGYAD